MTREPARAHDPEQVAEDVRARWRAFSQSVGQSTGVPLAVFGACDPMIEAKLLDDGIALLRHMNLDDALFLDARPPEVSDNDVAPQDVTAFLDGLGGIEAESDPDLLENLPLERLWVLLDIAAVGAGLARQRATAQLRASMQDLRACEGIETAHLHELLRMLAENPTEASMLYRALRQATRRALATTATLA